MRKTIGRPVEIQQRYAAVAGGRGISVTDRLGHGALPTSDGITPSAALVSMKGRRVLITGAASGIGRAMAKRFAEAGADLILLDIDPEGLARVAKDTGGACDVIAQVTDLCHKERIEAFWEEIGMALPDTLVNNAGVYPMRDFQKIDADFLDKVMSVNLESVLWMCQQFIRRRSSKGGVIVNVSSIEALLPFKHDLVAYSVSKAGVIALTRALARDYGRKGFRANVILPGAIRTPGTEGLAKTALRQFRLDLIRTGYDFQSRLALGRWGRPDEVACVALFLASGLASYIQGAVIPVDGGFLSS
jgi:NAD(P)-dependent dehydrogenase (short-subunit alcohol dehydrogenase family)